MKKITAAMLGLCLLLILAACGNGPQAPPPPPGPPAVEPPAIDALPEYDEPENDEPYEETADEAWSGEEPVIHISLASDALLATFDSIYEVDYTRLREARDGAAVEELNGDRLVLWADAPLRELSLILIGNDAIHDELFFIPIDSFGTIDTLLPGQAFVINSYVGFGTLPWSGIRFVDEQGEKRYFWMLHDHSGDMAPNPFVEPDFLGLFEEGELEIAILRDGRENRYITVNLDEIGAADPIDWFMENRHLWVSILLMEFENRSDELPPDWEPWWEAD